MAALDPKLPAQPKTPAKPQSKLRWRSDLRATAQALEGSRQVVIEDPVTGRFFRLGTNEYAFARALDGKRDAALALAFGNATEKDSPLSGQEAVTVLQFLQRNGLIEEILEGLPQKTRLAPPKSKKRMGALFQRLPIGNPNRLLDRLMPAMGWLAGWWLAPFWLAAAIWAGISLASHGERWVNEAGGILDGESLLLMPVAWFLLKVWHELNHGLVAKRYGADVIECGILFVLFAPIGGYVDATASWRLADRWKRIHVSAAGIIAEVFLGCIAIGIWATQEPGVVATLAYNVALLATISTVIFNANPLMRFDGYYVLIDLIQRPNLYQRGMLYVRYLGRRYLLGAGKGDLAAGAAAPRVIKLYGLLTLGWRWMVMTSMLIMATAWFSGLGVLLFVIGGATWLLLPAIKLTKRELQPGGVGRKGLVRATALVGGFAVLVTLLNFALPLRPSVQAPGLVAYVQASTLRAEAGGYVAEVAVRRGDHVEAGQLVVRLENPEMALEAAKLEAEIAAMQVQAAQALTLGDLETEGASRAKAGVLASQLAELRRQEASLTVTAPHAGVVVESELQDWQGAWMKRGQDLGELADPALLEFEISIPEQLVPAFRAHLGAEVTVDLPGGRVAAGRLIEVAPKGNLGKPEEALTALAGGPIALRSVKTEKGSEYQPLEAQFKGVVELPAELLRAAAPGELGWVTVTGEERSLFGLGYEAWKHWTGRILSAVTG